MQHRSRARLPTTRMHAHDGFTGCEPDLTVFSVEYTSLANSAMVDGRSKRPVHTSIHCLSLLPCSTFDVCVNMTRRKQQPWIMCMPRPSSGRWLHVAQWGARYMHAFSEGSVPVMADTSICSRSCMHRPEISLAGKVRTNIADSCRLCTPQHGRCGAHHWIPGHPLFKVCAQNEAHEALP